MSRPFRPPSISAASRLVTLTLQPLLLSHEIDGVRKEKERLTAIISLTPFPLLGLLPSYAVHSSLIHGRTWGSVVSERQTRRPEGEGVLRSLYSPSPGAPWAVSSLVHPSLVTIRPVGAPKGRRNRRWRMNEGPRGGSNGGMEMVKVKKKPTRLSRSSPALIPPLVTLAAQREGREPTGRTRSESGREVSDRHAERRGVTGMRFQGWSDDRSGNPTGEERWQLRGLGRVGREWATRRANGMGGGTEGQERSDQTEGGPVHDAKGEWKEPERNRPHHDDKRRDWGTKGVA